MENIRKTDLSNAAIIGKGQCSTVYKVDEKHAVKLYFPNISRESIDMEIARTTEGGRLGIGAAGCYGKVSCDGRIGMEMELINGLTLQEAIRESPDRIDEYALKSALRLRKIHSAEPDPGLFVNVKDFYSGCISGCRKDGWISEEEARKLEDFVNAVPDDVTMVHGDYHIMNIMEENGVIRLIDLADCMIGHPIFDLLVFNLYMNFMPHMMGELCEKLVGISCDKLLRFNDVFIRAYFDIADSDTGTFDKIENILNVYSMLKLMLAPYSFSNIRAEECKQYVELGRRQLMGIIDEYKGRIPEKIGDLVKA